MMRGILLLGGDDTVIHSRAKAAGLALEVGERPALPFEKTLIVEAGTRVPFGLLPAAWHFLERWDAAVPLWRYGVLAAGVGTPAEREFTKSIIRDLRVLLHATELLFVRASEAGEALVREWQREMDPVSFAQPAMDKRLAFLRALYEVKPRLCVLPANWLLQSGPQQPLMRRGVPATNAARPLVRVELEPGRFVKCHEGDEEKVLAQFQQQKEAGHARR